MNDFVLHSFLTELSIPGKYLRIVPFFFGSERSFPSKNDYNNISLGENIIILWLLTKFDHMRLTGVGDVYRDNCCYISLAVSSISIK